MFSAGDFGPGLFSEVLAATQNAGYAFSRFDRVLPPGKVFLLRHDVDISPRNARVLGRLARERDVTSNFFFQLNAETYNIFSDEVIDIMRELRGSGHCVGLHIDQARFGEDEGTIRRTIDWFSSSVLTIDDAVSFHRPSETVLGKRYTAFHNAYESRFFSPETYLSDSRRSIAFLPALADWLASGRPRIQLLLHPEWWAGINNNLGVWTELRARRQHELEQYLMINCRKVFSDVIAAETRDFRI